MELDEVAITKAIVKEFAEDFLSSTRLDVAIAGAGPSGLTAARYLAEKGLKVAVFERNLYVGGGMWGGGIMFPKIVVQESARAMLEEQGIGLKRFEEGYYVANSVETVAKSTAAAVESGAKIWIGLGVEDVMIRRQSEGIRVCGVVVNWGAVQIARLHVDPVSIRSKVVIDATGHNAEVVNTVVRKIPEVRLPTPTGKVMGEMPMWSEMGEKEIARNTQEVVPGLIVAGMAANAVFGSPRMGAIFGGMFISGRIAAELALHGLR